MSSNFLVDFADLFHALVKFVGLAGGSVILDAGVIGRSINDAYKEQMDREGFTDLIVVGEAGRSILGTDILKALDELAEIPFDKKTGYWYNGFVVKENTNPNIIHRLGWVYLLKFEWN